MPNRSTLILLTAWFWIVGFSGACPAQTGPTPEQLTLRPGDKIIWSDPSNGHVVQFGGGPLKRLSDIRKVLSFLPELEVSNDGESGFSQQGGSPMLTATVKADAAQSGVPVIDFTCGAHPNSMRSKLFQITSNTGQPTRELKIRATSNPNRWVLETSGGDVIIDAAFARSSSRVVASKDQSHRR